MEMDNRAIRFQFGIRGKLLGSFSIVLLLLVVICGITFFKMKSMGEAIVSINTTEMPKVVILGDLSRSVSNVNSLVSKMILEADVAERNKLLGLLDNAVTQSKERRKNYEPYLSQNSEKKLYQLFSSNWDAYMGKIPSIVEAAKAGNSPEAYKLLKGIDNILIDDSIMYLTLASQEEAKKQTDRSQQLYKSTVSLVINLGIIATVLGIVVAIVISHRLSRSINQIGAQVRRVSQGDFSVQPLHIRTKDEIGNLAFDFNHMTDNLRELLSRITSDFDQVIRNSDELLVSAEQTAQAANVISKSIEEVASGTQVQLNGTQNTMESVVEISNRMQTITQSIEQVSASSQEASNEAVKGNQTAEETADQMGVIKQKVHSTAEIIDQLNGFSIQIGTITELISNIAKQTNMLSLNAAIEAARSGEHGRGFAVVANEVRKLAAQTAASVEQIQDLVDNIQRQTGLAVASMAEGTEAVEKGIKLAVNAGSMFQEIARRIEEVSVQSLSVNHSAQEINNSASQVAGSMEQVTEASELAAGNTQHVAAAVEEQTASMEQVYGNVKNLSEMSKSLQEAIGRFKL